MVGIPSVGKMSRGVSRTARREPSMMAATKTSAVKGRRMDGLTMFMIIRVERRGSEPAGFHVLARPHNNDPTPDCKNLSARHPPSLRVLRFGNDQAMFDPLHQPNLLRTIRTNASALHHKI